MYVNQLPDRYQERAKGQATKFRPRQGKGNARVAVTLSVEQANNRTIADKTEGA